MNNRRNYYRILHVQPEAPIEIIKASYRSLMTKLNMHPDKGGDHESAALINQAYTVLSDPQRRRKYDEMLLSRNTQPHKRPTSQTHYSQDRPAAYTYRDFKESARTGSTTAWRQCLFCGTEHSAYVNKYCTKCSSPLAPVGENNRRSELFGRRTVPRIAKVGTLLLYPSWPHSGYSGQLRDLSTSGLNLLTAYAAKTGQIIKFDSNFLKGVARVVTVRANGGVFSLHATFLTVEFVTKAGLFVAEKA